MSPNVVSVATSALRRAAIGPCFESRSMTLRLTLFLLFLAFTLCDSLSAQVEYRRLQTTGLFRVPVFWTPFDPVNLPPSLGPGGADDIVIFDLGRPPTNRYIVSNIHGSNDQLIVEDDTLVLEFTGYEAVNDFVDISNINPSINIGRSNGHAADVVFRGSNNPGFDLQSQHSYIGSNVGSTGTVSAEGANFSWDAHSILVGFLGDGTLKIHDATVSDSRATVGHGRIATGFAMVAGPNALWLHSESLSVGLAGDGELVIQEAGQVNSTAARIGVIFGSSGTATVTGEDSFWATDEDLSIGVSGSGILRIENRGQVSAFTTSIGEEPAGNGEVVVDGNNSKLMTDYVLTVADEGTGTLLVQNAGAVECQTLSAASTADSVSEITIADPGSILQTTYAVNVSGEGEATLRLENGASIESPGTNIALYEGSEGRVVLTGSGTSLIGGSVASGRQGLAYLDIQDDAMLTTGSFTSGTTSTGRSVVEISSGGTMFVDGSTTLGVRGSVSARANAGAFVSSNDVWLGKYGGSYGSLSISESVWECNGRLLIGFNSDGIEPGTGRVTILPGGVCSIAEETILSSSGTLRLLGGSLSAGAIEIEDGGEFNWTSGILHTDLFGGDLLNQGGQLAPGNPIGSSVVQGDYIQDQNGSLEIEIAGAIANSQHDFVNVLGETLLDGQLKISVVDDFMPDPNQTFTILVADSIVGFFANVSDNERLETVDGKGSFLVRFGVTSPNPNQIILSDFQQNCCIVDNGVLTVSGTDNDDLVDVTSLNGTISVSMNGNTEEFSTVEIDRIVIEALDGDDEITIDVPNAEVYGGDGDDQITANGPGGKFLYGENGQDIILGGPGRDFIEGGLGMDLIDGLGGSDTIYGNSELSLIAEDDETDSNELFGGDGNDLIHGTSKVDTIDGGRGNDEIFGYGGNDVIDAFHGNDFVDGGDGHDSILAGLGNDEVLGGYGMDEIYGQSGRDYLVGGPGNDTILGGTNNDTIYGHDGNDFLFGNEGFDTIFGGNGSDEIRGGTEGDTLRGNAGHDSLYGQGGDDSLHGAAGSDYFNGGSGIDVGVDVGEAGEVSIEF